MGKDHILAITISGYRTSVEDVELSSTVQHNASEGDNSRTTVMVSFRDVTGIKPYMFRSLYNPTSVENHLRH
ncbi:hypothetical protein TNCV_3691681 [Trichonephila clavipes]|nr:hypothetical protein TNCV_3691681 [Trichonephila clavipes]